MCSGVVMVETSWPAWWACPPIGSRPAADERPPASDPAHGCRAAALPGLPDGWVPYSTRKAVSTPPVAGTPLPVTTKPDVPAFVSLWTISAPTCLLPGVPAITKVPDGT